MKNIKYLWMNVFALLCIVGFGLLAWQYQATVSPYGESDYSIFYHVLRNNHQNIYAPRYFVKILAKKHIHGKTAIFTTPPAEGINFNTPLMSLFLKGLVNISQRLSVNMAAWIALSLLGAAIGIWMLLSIATSNRSQLFLPLLLIFLFSSYSLDVFNGGQISFFIFPVSCLAFLFCYKNRTNALAVTLGLLGALKLFFLVFFFYFLAKKALKPFGVMLAAFLVFFFLPLFYFGSETYHHFFLLTHRTLTFIGKSGLSRNGSLLGFMANISYFFNSKITILQLRYFAFFVVGYFVMRSVIYDYQVLQKLPAFSEELRFSLYIILGLLCSPLAWIYYFVFLMIPLVVFYKIEQKYPLGKLFYICIFLGLTLCVLSKIPMTFGKFHWVLYIRQFSSFTALLCWLVAFILAVFHIQQQHNQEKKPNAFLLPIYIGATLLVIFYNTHFEHLSIFTWNKTQFLKNAKPMIEIDLKQLKKMYNPPHVKPITKNSH